MSKQANLVYFTMLFLALITAYSLYLPEQNADQPVVSSGLYVRIIWTDKETYELGEPVEAAIVFVNHNEYPISINPIYSYEFSGNSVYEPNKISGGVFVDYASDAKIMIPAKGNITFIDGSFTPTYPGPFKITGLGVSKTVNVTGYKLVRMNSTGIKLNLEPTKTVLKDRDYVEFSLVIINENPYPVKIPIVNKVFMGFDPDEMSPSMYLDWISRHFEIEANSRWVLPLRGFQVRYPGFSLYISIEGVTASLEMEVEK